MRINRFSRRGFSLLEMIVATAIFVASIAVVGRLLGIGLAASETSRTATMALLRCESKIAEIAAGIEAVPATEEAVVFADDLRWQWRAIAQPTAIAGLRLVSVTVERLDENNEPVFDQRLARLVADRPIVVRASGGDVEKQPITVRQMLGLADREKRTP